MSLPFIYSKVILKISASHILIFVSSFVIFPVKITPALISMLMYSCLHLTSEYVMANYHYIGRENRALTEVLVWEQKETNSAFWHGAQKLWLSILKLVESGEEGLLPCCLFFLVSFYYFLWTGGGSRMGLKFPLEHDVNMLACLLLLRCHPTDNKSCCVLPT